MNVIKQLSENQVILVLVPSMQYNDTILEVTKSLSKKKVCYVTLNKTFDSLKEIFKKNNVTMDNVIFIDAKEELRIERTNAWLEPNHIKKIADTYWKFKDVENFAKVMSNKDVLDNNGNLSLQLYVKQAEIANEHNTEDLIADIKTRQKQINASVENMFTQLKNIGIKA